MIICLFAFCFHPEPVGVKVGLTGPGLIVSGRITRSPFAPTFLLINIYPKPFGLCMLFVYTGVGSCAREAPFAREDVPFTNLGKKASTAESEIRHTEQIDSMTSQNRCLNFDTSTAFARAAVKVRGVQTRSLRFVHVHDALCAGRE